MKRIEKAVTALNNHRATAAARIRSARTQDLNTQEAADKAINAVTALIANVDNASTTADKVSREASTAARAAKKAGADAAPADALKAAADALKARAARTKKQITYCTNALKAIAKAAIKAAAAQERAAVKDDKKAAKDFAGTLADSLKFGTITKIVKYLLLCHFDGRNPDPEALEDGTGTASITAAQLAAAYNYELKDGVSINTHAKNLVHAINKLYPYRLKDNTPAALTAVLKETDAAKQKHIYIKITAATPAAVIKKSFAIALAKVTPDVITFAGVSESMDEDGRPNTPQFYKVTETTTAHGVTLITAAAAATDKTNKIIQARILSKRATTAANTATRRADALTDFETENGVTAADSIM